MSSVAVLSEERPVRHEYRLGRGIRLTWIAVGIVGLLLLPANVWLGIQNGIESYQGCVALWGADSPYCGAGPQPDWKYIAFGLFWGLWGVVYLLIAFRSRLTIDAEGIGFTDGFSWVRGAWADVASLTQQRSPILQVDFLYLRESRYDAPALLAWMAGPKVRQRIPISLFGRGWRSTPLGDDLRHYAPQLFGRED